MNETLKTIKNRRTIRAYDDKQIKQEELDLILEAGFYAPTGHNDQPWHFTVIQNKEKILDVNNKSKALMTESSIDWIRKIGQNPDSSITYNAPTLIIVSGRKDAISPKVDCCAAIMNMLLAAESLNIGSAWLGLVAFYFSLKEEVKALGITEEYEPYYGIVFGYKVESKTQTAPQRNRNVVNYIK